MLNSESLRVIKDSPWLWFAGVLLAAFVSGFTAYPALMTILGLTYVKESDLKTLKAASDSLPRLQQRLALVNAESQTRVNELLQRIQNQTPAPITQATPPSPTQTLRGSGTSETNIVSVAAASNARLVRITVRAEVTAAAEGSMQILVFGTAQPCQSGRFYRNASEPPRLSGEVVCQEALLAGEARQYRAEATNQQAHARTVDIEVVVTPQ
jgi:hypothetical protein